MINAVFSGFAATCRFIMKILAHSREIPWLIMRLSQKFRPTPYIILAGIGFLAFSSVAAVRSTNTQSAAYSTAAAKTADAHSAMGQAPPVSDDAPGH